MLHKDKEISQKFTQLFDELCEWERNTGRHSTLIFIPHNIEEEILTVIDGKPGCNLSINDAVYFAIRERTGFHFQSRESEGSKWVPLEETQKLETKLKQVKEHNKTVTNLLLERNRQIVEANKILANPPRDLSLEAEKMFNRLCEVLNQSSEKVKENEK